MLHFFFDKVVFLNIKGKRGGVVERTQRVTMANTTR